MAKLDKPKGKKTVTSDERFAGVHSDPRFRVPGKKHIKGTIDDRFKDVIDKDERFQDKVIVDKYGRKIKKNNKKELKKYYYVDEDKEKPKEESEDGTSDDDKVSAGIDDGSESEESSEESSNESDSDSEEFDPARGKGVSSSESSEESSSESESESEDEEEEEDQVELDPEVAARQKKDPIPMGEETSRFAVVNMDWDNIRAVDLMATLSSFVPPRGRIESVRIYPSEYGKMRMAKEEVEGPSREFFSKKKKGKKSRAEEEDEEEINEKTIVKEDKGEEVDSSTLRKYQLQRLQYYYAVVTCDSKVTARNIYDNVDGTEYESTANFFDLRYIPEGMDFDDKPRDECTKIPADYKPNAFVTDALQHSKVKLTWDETPSDRLKMASKAFSQKEIDDMDFKAYLASDSESDAEELKSKYQSLLGGVLGPKEDDMDMEITFTPGGGDNNDQAEESESGEETTIEKYRRKEKERRKRRMEKLKAKKEEGDESAKGLSKKEEEAKKAAELELLAMDDEAPLTNNTTTNKKSKGKMSKKLQAAEEAEAEVDTSDPRFQALFDNPEFAIDTTAPQFKKTKAMSKLQEERRKRVKSGDDNEPTNKKRKKVSSGGDDLQSLVSKLKQRAKK